MKFISLQLKGYKRISLNSIDELTITFENMIILILGTNGSGKSSLLAQLTPLPGNHTDFTKEGHKIIELTHKGSTYVLKNFFRSTGNKYHFIKDGEEAHEGGVTITVFKELIRKEFGLTQDIHDLLTGQIKFHLMKANEKRNLFTRLADTDYTYALSYYGKLKERHRDLIGAIKMLQSRLVQETEKLISPEREAELKEEIRCLRETLTRFLDAKQPLAVTVTEGLTSIKRDDLALEKDAMNLIHSLREFKNPEGFDSIEAIGQALMESYGNQKASDSKITSIFEQIEKKQKTVETLKSSNLASFKDIDKQIDALVQQIADERKLIHRPDNPNPELALDIVNNLQANLSDVLVRVSEFTRYNFNRESYKVLDAEKDKQILLVRGVENHIQELETKKKELEHLKEHGNTECPKCHHVWIKGFNSSTYDNIVKSIAEYRGTLQTLETQRNKKIAEFDECVKFFELMQIYGGMVRSSPGISDFWKDVNDRELFFKQPNAVLTALVDYRDDVTRMIRVKLLEKELKSVLELKQLTVSNQESSLQSLELELEELNKQLFKENETRNHWKNKHGLYTRYRQIALYAQSASGELDTRIKKRDGSLTQILQSVYTEYINECVNLIKIELNTREQQLSKIDIQKALVASLDKQIKEHSENEELLKIAVRELSPTEGLIAKGMSGFINRFVQQMNSFIKKIWLYPLELVPIVPTEQDVIDLDYKFTVKINENVSIPDVAVASSAMKEVIDLAFMVVSMPYLGLAESPLYLDEFSKAMDSEHRKSAFYAITNLMTSSNFTQIFLISHYENTYGSIKNSDVIVLCPANVGIPKDMIYNKHVTMR